MKITDKVYMLDATRGAYVYLILGEEIMLVDTGLSWTRKGILRELDGLGIKPRDIKRILLTHHDLDHTGNAVMLQKLTGAELWASEEDIPYIIEEKSRPGIKKVFSTIFRVNKPDNIKAYSKNQKFGEVKIIPTPGHTPGHVCILFEDVMFVGDLLQSKKGQLRPYPRLNWDVSALNESVKEIYKYSFKWICPAHGNPVQKS